MRDAVKLWESSKLSPYRVIVLEGSDGAVQVPQKRLEDIRYGQTGNTVCVSWISSPAAPPSYLQSRPEGLQRLEHRHGHGAFVHLHPQVPVVEAGVVLDGPVVLWQGHRGHSGWSQCLHLGGTARRQQLPRNMLRSSSSCSMMAPFTRYSK